jgi:hypothetical protein
MPKHLAFFMSGGARLFNTNFGNNDPILSIKGLIFSGQKTGGLRLIYSDLLILLNFLKKFRILRLFLLWLNCGML